MESWIDKSKEEITKEIFDLSEETTGLKNIKSSGVLNSFLQVICKCVIKIYDFLNNLYTQISIDKATGFFLSCWGRLLGVEQKESTKTKGNFTGNAYGSLQIVKGSWIQVTNFKLRFKVLEDININNSGEFSIPVEAEFEGSKYNLTANTPVHFPKVINGLEAVSIKTDWISEYGQDEEKDDVYRARIRDKWNAQGEGNPPSRYEYLAKKIQGVRNAKIIRTPRGYGSADLIIVSENGIPTQALIDQVYDSLNSASLICRDFIIKPPGEKIINFDIRFSGTATVENVDFQIRNFINGLDIGSLLEIRYLYQLFTDKSFSSFEILNPGENIQAGSSEIFTIQEFNIARV